MLILSPRNSVPIITFLKRYQLWLQNRNYSAPSLCNNSVCFFLCISTVATDTFSVKNCIVYSHSVAVGNKVFVSGEGQKNGSQCLPRCGESYSVRHDAPVGHLAWASLVASWHSLWGVAHLCPCRRVSRTGLMFIQQLCDNLN